MDSGIVGFALAAGLIAAFNPCGFAMLPAYLTLVVLGEERSRGTVTAVSRALAATVMMAFGFLLVFGTFGLVIAPLAGQAQRLLPFVTVVIGVALLVLGAWLASGREPAILLPKPRAGAPTARLGSMFGYGLAYALASLSCTVGPFLAVTGQTFRSGSPGEGVLAFLAYGAGMALVVGVLAVAVALAGAEVATRAKRVLPYVNRVAGGLLLLAGAYVTYYGVYELRLFHGAGNAADPVIGAAIAIQQWLSATVNGVGALPLLGVLTIVVLGALLIGRRRARSNKRA